MALFLVGLCSHSFLLQEHYLITILQSKIYDFLQFQSFFFFCMLFKPESQSSHKFFITFWCGIFCRCMGNSSKFNRFIVEFVILKENKLFLYVLDDVFKAGVKVHSLSSPRIFSSFPLLNASAFLL